MNAAGDVLKGLNGVYNMNTRTAGGAITPNIRGVTGKGRIPVTLDGTEQTVDVSPNRTYVFVFDVGHKVPDLRTQCYSTILALCVSTSACKRSASSSTPSGKR